MRRARECRLWVLTAVSALAIAGVFALLLVLSRTPGIQVVFDGGDGSFFHKGLVTHVVFSFVVWFLCSYAVVATCQKSVSEGWGIGRIALGLVWGGFIGLSYPALSGQGEAELNNYVPVMNHPIYTIGLWMCFSGIGLVVYRQLTETKIRNWSLVEYAGVIYYIAIIAFLIARFKIPTTLGNANYQEHLYWAGGHILQFFNTALILLAWSLCFKLYKGVELAAPRQQKGMFLILTLFAVFGLFPLLVENFFNSVYQNFYTDLLRYGLPVPIIFFSVYLFTSLYRNGPFFHSFNFALWLSLLLFSVGGLMGIFLDGPDTRVPAHYHATIGGINMALMAFFFHCALPYVGVQKEVVDKKRKWITAQYGLYGFGQLFHASGLFIAGFFGVMRKTGGEAQGLDSLEKVSSMVLMGIGGVTSVLGGALFVLLIFSCFRNYRGEVRYVET